ncbi:unnamed protein product [Dibothriocephalus latus]|uniref:Uncharacterized protein n=1 Tax=Dibothriocephalus latus TaxID=60516 RepID=A0A3P6SRT5_DIBLA|nr:unnamed protein product [Dibothriocephalus latus]
MHPDLVASTSETVVTCEHTIGLQAIKVRPYDIIVVVDFLLLLLYTPPAQTITTKRIWFDGLDAAVLQAEEDVPPAKDNAEDKEVEELGRAPDPIEETRWWKAIIERVKRAVPIDVLGEK